MENNTNEANLNQERSLGLIPMVAFSVGCCLASGVFAIPGDFANSGAYTLASLLGWLVAGVGMLSLMMSYFNLSIAKPELTSGLYTYSKAGFGEYVGFNAAWGYWLSAILAYVTFQVGLFGSLSEVIPWLESGSSIKSLILGSIAGWGLTQLEKLFHSNTNRLAMTIGFVFLTVALAKLSIPLGAAKLGFSSLLVCMMLGSVFCNLCPLSEEIMTRSDKWTAPLLVLFFVLSGAELELGVFAHFSSVLIGVVYILARCFGKYFGARESSRLMKCGPKVVEYLGITLFPQAGVALGMCVTASQLPGDGTLIRNIVLFAVLVYELVGPVMTKWALTKAGDIQPKSEEILTRRQRKLAAVAAKK